MPRTKRDYAERLAEIEQRETAAKVKIDAIRAEKRRLQNREREKERKARTKRLIEIGAVMEHVLGRPIEHGDLPALQEAVEQFEHAEKSPKGFFVKKTGCAVSCTVLEISAKLFLKSETGLIIFILSTSLFKILS